MAQVAAVNWLPDWYGRTEKVSLEHKAVLYQLDEQEVHGSTKST
jgi:hypothetical protein